MICSDPSPIAAHWMKSLPVRNQHLAERLRERCSNRRERHFVHVWVRADPVALSVLQCDRLTFELRQGNRCFQRPVPAVVLLVHFQRHLLRRRILQ